MPLAQGIPLGVEKGGPVGLDMYLRAEKYVSGWKGDDDSEYKKLARAFDFEEFLTDESPAAFVKFTVAYWRKANQIHSWFVRECQGGVDDCKPYYVSHDQLGELGRICTGLLLTRARHGEEQAAAAARAQLEPADGFFFGLTEIGPWYWEQLERTVDQLDRVMRIDPRYWSIYYQSSW
jgi:hypothetical protein